MAIKNIEFIQIEAVLDSLGRKQIGVESEVDSELNFRMWGGKDSTGALTHWLAKNKPGLLHSLRLSSLAGQSQSIANIDANGNIVRGSSGVTTTVSEITENTNVTLVAGQNRYLNCTNSPTITVEIADNNIYHLQINGSCTLALTGVTWGGDEITAITTKAEISILNGIAVGVLYE